MILSRSSTYGLQAMIYLASKDGEDPLMNTDIASFLGVPAPYLTKLMKLYVRQGLAGSRRGRGGGYWITPLGLGASIRQLVEVIDGDQAFESCLLGLKRCEDATACPVHFQWSPVKARMLQLLQTTDLGQMAEQVRSGKYRLVSPARGRRGG
jgi:Rrf2 family protein